MEERSNVQRLLFHYSSHMGACQPYQRYEENEVGGVWNRRYAELNSDRHNIQRQKVDRSQRKMQKMTQQSTYTYSMRVSNETPKGRE